MKIIGRRKSRTIGVLAEPDKATQRWFKEMGNYRIKVPARIIRYRSHEEANQDRQQWQAERIVKTEATLVKRS